MGEKSRKEGLDLSLALGLGIGCATKTTSSSSTGSLKHGGVSRPPHPPSSPSSPFPLNLAHHSIKSPSWNLDVFPRGLMMFDMNRDPPTSHHHHQAAEDESGVSSPNSTVSSVVSGKRSERTEATAGVAAGEDIDTEGERTSCSRDGSDEDDENEEDGGAAGRKKLRLSKEQAVVLEETFKEHSTLTPKQKVGLAKELNLRPRQVEVWFQNRRARTKLKQTEVDCEYLKSCCENLREENRRLQKEVQELRALKLSPNFYMQHMNPPTTLTMCPSCERVSSSSSTTQLANTSANNRNQLALSISPWAAIPVPDHHNR